MSKDPKPVTPEGVECRDSIVFGTGGGRELSADLYLPSEPAGSALPAVVYVHGGAWSGGSRAQFSRHAIAMALRGYAGLCIEYRLSDKASYPGPVQDVNCAVRFLRAFADDLGIDAGRIAVAGGSAGGHLAAMVATTCRMRRLEGTGGHGDFSSDVQALVGFNPVLDVREMTEVPAVVDFLGGSPRDVGQEVYEDASPICHVSKGTPPTLLLHGTADSTVPYQQSVRFCEAVRKAGGHAELFTAEGAEHGFFNSDPWFEPTLARMVEFLLQQLGPAPQ
jgi:acetyl esterase/lipase